MDESILMEIIRALIGSGGMGARQPTGPSSISGGPPLGRGGSGGSMDVEKLLKKLGEASAPQPLPDWATRMPANTTELLRQLSANVGQQAMPGGYVGAVTLPAYGSSQQPTQGIDARTYGQGGGESTFFQQSMRGGMTPLAGLAPLGVPQGWDPFGTAKPPKEDDKKKKKDKGKPVTTPALAPSPSANLINSTFPGV